MNLRYDILIHVEIWALAGRWALGLCSARQAASSRVACIKTRGQVLAMKAQLFFPQIPREMRTVMERMEQEGRGVLAVSSGDAEPVRLSKAVLDGVTPSIRAAPRKAIVLVLATPARVQVEVRDAQALVDGAPPDAIDGFGDDVRRAVENFDRNTEVPCLLTDADQHTFLFMQPL